MDARTSHGDGGNRDNRNGDDRDSHDDDSLHSIRRDDMACRPNVHDNPSRGIPYPYVVYRTYNHSPRCFFLFTLYNMTSGRIGAYLIHK